MATALMDSYATYALAHAAVEAIDDTKIIAVFRWREKDTRDDVIVVVRKT
jgi:hypothetical protein